MSAPSVHFLCRFDVEYFDAVPDCVEFNESLVDAKIVSELIVK